MNIRPKQRFLSRFRKGGNRRNRGFTLPLIISITLVMMVISLTLLVASQAERIQAGARVTRVGGTAAAETGVARVLALFKTLPELSSSDLGGWGPVYATATSRPCGAAGQDPVYETLVTQSLKPLDQRWVSLGGSGDFRLVEYDYSETTKTGTLEIEGRAHAEGDVANSETDVSNSVVGLRVTVPTSLQVNFGVERPMFYYPSLWLGQRGITASPAYRWWQATTPPSPRPLDDLAAIRNPVVPGSGGKLLFTYSAQDPTPGLACPNPLPGPEQALTAVTALTPTPPKIIGDSIDSSLLTALGAQSAQGLAVDYTPLRFPKLPPYPTGAIVLGAIDSNQTLPRSGDTPDASGRYHYVLRSDSSGLSLKLHNQTLTIQAPTSLYLLGNLQVSGASGRLICTSACTTLKGTGLQIYGSDGTQTYKLSGEPDGSNLTTQMTVRDGGQILADDLFLFAPLATLSVGEGGGAYQNHRGSTWVNQLVLPAGAIALQEWGEGTVEVKITLPSGQQLWGRSLNPDGVAALPLELQRQNPEVEAVAGPTPAGGMFVPPALLGRLPRSTAAPVRAWTEQQTRL